MDHSVQVYGYRYHHPTQSVVRIGELPPWSTDLAVRLCRDGLVPTVPNQLVVTDYAPGSGIFAHVDQAAFGDTVASVSLGSSCVMQFTRSAREDVRHLLLEPRSLLILGGAARWDWQHGIPARATDTWQHLELRRAWRVSLTFRSVCL